MKFINAQNIKTLAKEYGEELRGQETRVGADFLIDIDRCIEQVVMAAVRTQADASRKTLQSTEWLQRQIRNGATITQEHNEER